jgi:hypothetical protein
MLLDRLLQYSILQQLEGPDSNSSHLSKDFSIIYLLHVAIFGVFMSAGATSNLRVNTTLMLSFAKSFEGIRTLISHNSPA